MAFFTLDLAVRGYEIDGLGHVNNAVYCNWLEHSRWEMMLSGPLPPLPEGVQVMVRRLELDYVGQTRMGDHVRITQWPRSASHSTVVLGGSIDLIDASGAPLGRTVLRATQVITCVRVGGGKAPLPDSWRALVPAVDPGDRLP